MRAIRSFLVLDLDAPGGLLGLGLVGDVLEHGSVSK